MVPEAAEPSTFWEHVHRYRLALQFVRGRHVLDIACGEGYGAAALLASGAASVVGVDISQEACRHAASRYGLKTRQGSAEAIPLDDQSVDLVVSFETIEHVKDPEKFIEECHRVLRPGGLFLVSTPNTLVYGDGVDNEFHYSEMTPEQFLALLRQAFAVDQIWSQRPTRGLNSNQELALPGRVLRRGLRRVLRVPEPGRDVPQALRSDPVRAILQRDLSVGNLVNPYACRPGLREATYLVALGRR